jgi:hypothetical protein
LQDTCLPIISIQHGCFNRLLVQQLYSNMLEHQACITFLCRLHLAAPCDLCSVMHCRSTMHSR